MEICRERNNIYKEDKKIEKNIYLFCIFIILKN